MRTDFMLNVNRSDDDIIIKGYVDDDSNVVITEPDTGGGGGGGVGSVFYEVVDVVCDNVNRNRTIIVPISDTSYDNYLVDWRLLETGVYVDGTLVMDSSPTVRSSDLITLGGLQYKPKTHQTSSGKFIKTDNTESDKIYQSFRMSSVNANASGGISGASSDVVMTVGENSLTVSCASSGYDYYGKEGLYTKYRFLVWGWNEPSTD